MNISFFVKKKQEHVKNGIKIFNLKFGSLIQPFHQNIEYHKYLFFFILLGVFLLLFFLNYKTPMIGDDYSYSFIFSTSDRISSLSDIFESQYLHYYGWGGRSVVHAIAQALLLFSSPLLIDLFNAFAFLAFICLMYLHVLGKRNVYDIRLLIVLFASVWILQPAFGETILWITGSANYLWGMLIILLFLLPYRFYKPVAGNKVSRNVLYACLMFLGGIIAGWTNENTALGMILIITMYIVYYKYNEWTIRSWVYWGMLGAIVGYIFMIMAPGNFVRAEGTSISSFHILYRTLTATQSFVYYLGILNLGIAILSILYLKFSDMSKRRVIPFMIIYYTGVFVSIYSMVASPGFPPRAWFGSITLNIIVLGIVFWNQNYKEPFLSYIKNSVVIFCLAFFFFSLYDAYKDINSIDKIWKDRQVVLERKKNEGATQVVFKEYQAKTKFGLGDAPYAKKYISDYYSIEFELEK